MNESINWVRVDPPVHEEVLLVKVLLNGKEEITRATWIDGPKNKRGFYFRDAKYLGGGVLAWAHDDPFPNVPMIFASRP